MEVLAHTFQRIESFKAKVAFWNSFELCKSLIINYAWASQIQYKFSLELNRELNLIFTVQKFLSFRFDSNFDFFFEALTYVVLNFAVSHWVHELFAFSRSKISDCYWKITLYHLHLLRWRRVPQRVGTCFQPAIGRLSPSYPGLLLLYTLRFRPGIGI